MALIEITDECIEWPLARDRRDGYGVIRHGGAFSRAYRLVYHLFRGPIPRGMSVLHTCDNRLCVNPAHLWLGTQADNMRDMAAKGRSSRGMSHARAKLTDDLVRLIRSGKHSVAELEVITGLKKSALYSVRSGQTWRHIA